MNRAHKHAIKHGLNRKPKDPQQPLAETPKQLLELVLKLNVFKFSNEHYLQIFSTAMGSKLARAYANAFMGQLEANILANSHLKPTLYCRFIDDIFLLWPYSKEELDQLSLGITQHNNQHWHPEPNQQTTTMSYHQNG